MRPIFFLFLFLFIVLPSLNGQQISLASVSGMTVNQAVERCGIEGKLLFVFFYAEWVQPCQWMKTNTFSDPELISFFNNNTIFLELNLDSQLGSTEKENFKVNLLPTMILFDASGNQLIKIEEAMNANKLLTLLQTWNFAENRGSNGGKMAKNNAEISFRDLNKKQLIPESVNPVIESDDFNYGIIVKYFYNYDQALSFVQEFQRRLDKRVIFHEKKLSNEIRQFQIIVSKFSNKEEARAYLPQLRMLGISGEIIKL